jgi:cellulose synthase/poly-beta-1,6-N-acetylglucosamine synthase-like glycosyltransferase
MLEFALLEEKIKVKYLEDAIVYDEKLEKQEQFEGQRSRWVAARFFFLKSEAKNSFKKLIQLDFDYFNKWLQFLLPQKTLLITNVILFAGLSLLFSVNPGLSIMLLAVLITAFALGVPREFYSFKTVKALASLPAMILGMSKILFNIKKVDPSKFNVTLKEV